MLNAYSIKWTNSSVRAFAKNADPLTAIEDAARSLVLRARENGWEGPPFNPLHIAEMLGVQVEANSNVADARLVATKSGPKIEFNPQQPRERVRFSIAHEIAHLLFPDWSEQVRNRGGDKAADDWQLEMLCNLAASEFVLPIGSLSAASDIPSIEDLMRQRREYDVSAEAFLIRLAKISNQPIGIFVSSPTVADNGRRRYKIDYFVSSPTAPKVPLSGMVIPDESIVHRCTAIGHTDRSVESWVLGVPTQIECVGLTAYPGSVYPRVAGLVRFDQAQENHLPIRQIHGSVLEPRNGGKKIICQLVNDKAIKWGGGVARKIAKRFPDAEVAYTEKVIQVPQRDRLGHVIFSEAGEDITIASLIGQEGFGPSLFPRIRYAALQSCLEQVADHAASIGATIHMPKIGTGSAGGDWSTIEEMLDDVMVRAGLFVTIYDIPPKRVQLELL
ncbi:ImmA/IrrE family metallo-endopeptidase [Mariluticola halotolerans]|uniref:ImmA/IrrE family metallo-endopeptidase n=1 Tax=Mariluticola halotolerans TaxID=2909283 RepID=UPI0026E2E007|nr:ImmA/IrrE family metallo-endopeptidase [Mariluticola halotolerans]UJQ94152.1 macro domain-containing protein [Mariluticola halotolerans]